MNNSNTPWFSCCNGDAIKHDKWQDIDPKARSAAQREIDLITGKASSESQSTNTNSHTQKFNHQKYSNSNPNNKAMSKQKPKTTKNVVNSVEESIIYGRFDDLIDSNSYIKPAPVGQHNNRIAGNVEYQKQQIVYPHGQHQVYQVYQPQIQQQVYQPAQQNNVYLRR